MLFSPVTCFSPSWLCLTDSKPLRDCTKRKKVVKTDSSGIKLMTCNILSFQMTKRHSKLVQLLTFMTFLHYNSSAWIFIVISLTWFYISNTYFFELLIISISYLLEISKNLGKALLFKKCPKTISNNAMDTKFVLVDL